MDKNCHNLEATLLKFETKAQIQKPLNVLEEYKFSVHIDLFMHMVRVHTYTHVHI